MLVNILIHNIEKRVAKCLYFEFYFQAYCKTLKMVFKRKADVKNIHMKKMIQDTRKRKAKMKIKSNKFFMDQQGEGRPAKFSRGNVAKAEDTLGYDPLVQKERYIILNLTVSIKHMQGYDSGDSEMMVLMHV